MKKTFLYMSVVVVAVLNFSCQGEKHAAVVTIPSTTPGGPSVVSEVEGVPNGSPLFVKVGTSWESDTTNTYSFYQSCYIAPGTVAGGPDATCLVTIPELKLFFSNVRFRVGSLDPVKCAHLNFQPYYFRRSNKLIKNTFEYNGANIDCGNGSQAKECYGGPAPIIMADAWPKSTSKYFLPAVGNQMDFDIASSNSLRQFGQKRINWMITSDISSDAAGQVTPAADPMDPTVVTPVDYKEKVPGSAYWQPYEVSCEDIWGEPQYTIQFVISDENTVDEVNGSTLDTFEDWY